MTIKRAKIKTKKSMIIYNQGWVVVDGNYMIKRSHCELDDSLLQNYVDNDIPFIKESGGLVRTEGVFPDTDKLVPKNLTEYTTLYDTGLVAVDNMDKPRVFHNLDKQYIALFKDEYYKVFESQTIDTVTYKQNAKLSGVCVVTPHDEVIGYIMPIQNGGSVLKGFILHYGNQANEETYVTL